MARKLAFFNPPFNHLSWDALLEYCQGAGIKYLELGTGAYPGDAHCHPKTLLHDGDKRERWRTALSSTDITVGALSCHGNPLHPDPEIAEAHHQALIDTIKLAPVLGVSTVVAFSGCPGGMDKNPNTDTSGQYPVWPTVYWPLEQSETAAWQWREKLIPYWQKIGDLAEQHKVNIALEMHGAMLVHSPATALALREATHSRIGVNLDPSHMWWQHIDPIAAVKLLGEAIFHVHLKDTVFNQEQLNLYGLLDLRPFDNAEQRAWRFTTPGNGHPKEWWLQFITALEKQGYTGLYSVEHEDDEIKVEDAIAEVKDMFDSFD